MKPTTTTQTVWRGKNPFTGEQVPAPAPAPRKAHSPNLRGIVPSELRITDDPLPAKRIPVKTAWDALFERLKPGRRIVCQPGQEKAVGDALRRWLRREGKQSLRVSIAARHLADDMAGVWLVEAKK